MCTAFLQGVIAYLSVHAQLLPEERLEKIEQSATTVNMLKAMLSMSD